MKEKLIELIKGSKFLVTLTGAGISTESGIPDFRSDGGLYSEKNKFQGYGPSEILSRRFFIKEPEIFYEFYTQRLKSFIDNKPNRSHFALAKLEKDGILKCIITQNIDNLHQSAGNSHVLDLHGNGVKFQCIGCQDIYSAEKFLELMEKSKIPRCVCGGKIKPMTVLFGESLNEEVYNTSEFIIKQSDLLISIGSSLLVQPAADLLMKKPEGCKLVIINNMKTPYDGDADLVINENCGDVLDYVMEKL